MPTVYALNNYDFSSARAGEMPANHLFGCGGPLPAGWDVEYVPKMLHQVLGGGPTARRIAGIVWSLIGDPIQAVWAWRASSRKRGIVWICSQAVASSALILRWVHLIRSPVVVLVHNKGVPKPQRKLMRVADAVVVFSDQVRASLLRDGLRPQQVHVLPWGPDLSWLPYATAPSPDRVEVAGFGKTYRDFRATRTAAVEEGWRAEIVEGSTQYSIRNGRESIMTGCARVPNEAMIARIKGATAVVIPVSGEAPSRGMSGLTELCDAVACSTPVIMTRNTDLPFDIEEIGVGIWVDADASPSQYVAALARVPSIDPEDFVRLRQWWSQDEFSRGLFSLFSDLTTSRGGHD